jgi:hypothetical protein
MAAAAVAVVGLVLTGAVLAEQGRPHQAVESSPAVAFREDGAVVGFLTAGGQPSWVYVNVHGLPFSGPVSCQLVEGNGSVDTLGLFDVVHGSGSWAAPDPPVLAATTRRDSSIIQVG